MQSREEWDELRPLLFSIAYRMLGSATEAEDIVQEGFVRRYEAERRGEEVRSDRAFLTTVTTRLCIDQLRSARVRREEYIGPWLPEPLLTDPTTGGEERVMVDETLSMAYLVLLESLTPVERAVFLLHDVFEYDYAEIAGIVDRSEANCRQIARRARQQVEAGRPRFEVSRDQWHEAIGRFTHACETGDLDAMVSLLADEITLWSDGGGKVPAALNPIYGADKVARFLLGIVSKAPLPPEYRVVEVNGRPAIASSMAGRLYSVLTFDVADGSIQAMRIVRNPEKLARMVAHLEPGGLVLAGE